MWDTAYTFIYSSAVLELAVTTVSKGEKSYILGCISARLSWPWIFRLRLQHREVLGSRSRGVLRRRTRESLPPLLEPAMGKRGRPPRSEAHS